MGNNKKGFKVMLRVAINQLRTRKRVKERLRGNVEVRVRVRISFSEA